MLCESQGGMGEDKGVISEQLIVCSHELDTP